MKRALQRRLTTPNLTILPIVAIIALAVALVVVGLLRSPPVDWAQVVGDLIPGWPWW